MKPEQNERLYTLDALRGIAAIGVAIGHAGAFMAPIAPRQSGIAVDLFFVMSGVVLDRAYRGRLATGMTASRFMLLRYIRLYPLYLLAMILAIASGYIALRAGRGGLLPSTFATAAAFGLLLLPSPTMTATDEIAPLNKSAWSLVFELIANLAYAAWQKYLTTRNLIAIIAIAFCGMLASIWAYGDFVQGFWWSTLPAGFPRVFFSFFLGVLIQRKLPLWSVSTHWAWAIPALFGLVIFAPLQFFNPVALNLVLVAVGCPAIVIAGTLVQPKSVKPFAAFGDISYPLYVLHVPLIDITWRAMHLSRSSPEDWAPTVGIAFLSVLCLACFWLDRYFDIPVRRWLAGQLRNWRRDLVKLPQ